MLNDSHKNKEIQRSNWFHMALLMPKVLPRYRYLTSRLNCITFFRVPNKTITKR